MTQLLSKIVAGGLSAAVILIWWPRFFPVDSVETWLARGVIWTLTFELLLSAIAPLEEALWRSSAARRVRSRAAAAGMKLTRDNQRARVRGRSAVACAAIGVPVFLLATAPAPPADEPVRTAAVKHVTQIKRVVRVEPPRPERVGGASAIAAGPSVRPQSAAAPATPAAPVRSSAPAARKRTTRTPARRPAQTRQSPSSGRGTGDATPAPTTVETQPSAPQAAEPQREPAANGAGDASKRLFAG